MFPMEKLFPIVLILMMCNANGVYLSLGDYDDGADSDGGVQHVHEKISEGTLPQAKGSNMHLSDMWEIPWEL